MADKQIKISIVADERAAQRTKEIVQDLTRTIDQLAAAGRRAMQGVGGITGGGGVSVGTKPLTGVSGGIAGATARAGQAAQGIVPGILGVQNVGALRQLVTGTQGAFQSIAANIKTFVDRAENDVKRLQRAVAGLGASMGAIGPMGGGGGSGGVAGSPPPPPAAALAVMSPGAAMSGPAAGGVPGRRRLSPGVSPPPQPNQGQGGGFFGEFWGSSGLSSLPGGQAIGTLGRIMSGRLGGAAAGGAIAAAVGAGAMAISGMEQDTRVGNLRYGLQLPSQTQSQRAQVASPFLGMYRAARGGDAAMGSAYDKALHDPAIMRSVTMSNAQRRELAEKLTGYSGVTFTALKNKLTSFAGHQAEHGGFQILMDQIGQEKDPVTRRALQDLAMEQAQRGMTPEAWSQFERTAQDVRTTMSPRGAEMTNYVVSGAGGNLATRRAGFFGVPRGREAMEFGLDQDAYYAARGRSRGEVGGANRSIVTGAGRGYLNKIGGMGLLSMQDAGVTGAESILRMSGILGGSVRAGVRGLTGRGGLQNNVGRGGMDVTAGSELFHSLLSRSMGFGPAGGFGGTAQAFVQGAAGLVAGGGADVAQQMARSGMVERGLGGLNEMTSGSRSGLQNAISSISAISATGGYSYLAQRMKETPAEVLIGIARGGAVPRGLLDLQGSVVARPGESQQQARERATRESVAKFLAGSEAGTFAEMIPGLFKGGSTAGALISGFKASGKTFGQFVAGKSARRQQEIAESMGGAVSTHSGKGADLLMAELVRYAPKLNAKGAYGPRPSGLEREGLNHAAGQLHRDASEMRTDVEGKKRAVGLLNPLGDTGGQAVASLGNLPGLASVDSEFQMLAGVIHKAVERISKSLVQLPPERGARAR